MARRGTLFYVQLAFALVVCAFLIVPIGLSIVAGLMVNYQTGIASGLTLRWVIEVWSGYRDTMFLSVGPALACLVATLLLGVPAAYALDKRQSRLTRFIEELLVMPVALPGLATALALIVTYGSVRGFRTSWLFILVGHILFTLPFMVRSVLAVMLAIDLKTLEEGAASLGAGFRRRFLDTVLPNCRSGIVAGSLMLLTLSIGEFNMTWLLHTPLNKTLPVGLADAYASLRFEVGSAYTLIFFIMIVPLLLALQRAARPPHVETRHDEGRRTMVPRAEPVCITLTSCQKTFADGTRARWQDDQLVSHVAVLGDWPGPFPFFDALGASLSIELFGSISP